MAKYTWQDAYLQVVLETDNHRLAERIPEIRRVLNTRIEELVLPEGLDEQRTLVEALHNLRQLWIERIARAYGDDPARR